MSTKHRHGHDDVAEPQWMSALEAMLTAAGREPTHRPNQIEFAAGESLVTRVRLRGHGASRPGGTRVEAVAEVTTPLPPSEVSPPGEVIELCNRMALLGALATGSAGGPARVCSRLSFPADDAATSRLYLTLLRAAALLQASWLVRCMAWIDGREVASRAELPAAHEASHATPAQLKKAEKLLDKRDIFCDIEGARLKAEFVWPEGAGRALQGEVPSRFQLDAKNGHPVFGAGLAHELELPEELGTRSHAVACALNDLEAGADHGAPLLGAWCRTLDGRGVAHVGFVPNSVYSDGLAAHFCAWAEERSRWARERILVLDVG